MYALYLFPFCSTGQRFTDHISSGTLQSLAEVDQLSKLGHTGLHTGNLNFKGLRQLT